jgi:CheY-like chemotaxis protein
LSRHVRIATKSKAVHRQFSLNLAGARFAYQQVMLQAADCYAPETIPEDALTLVVDDNDDLRATLGETLEEMGHKVVEARNGQEAFNFLVLNPLAKVRLILLDLQMPLMTGWEFLALVKSYIRLSRIPIVVASSYAFTLQGNQAQQVQGCLMAPFDMGHLRAMVASLAPQPA